MTARTVAARDLAVGMQVTHRGWLHADTRRLVTYEVVGVRMKRRQGGLRSGHALWDETVLLHTEFERRGERVSTRITVPGWERFRLVAAP